jgi:hypothetical protein
LRRPNELGFRGGLATNAGARLCDGCDGCDARNRESPEGARDGCDGRDGDSYPFTLRKEEGWGCRHAAARSDGRSPGAVTSVTVVTRPPGDAPHQADPRLARLWFACLASSTGGGLAAPPPRPVVSRAHRRGGRRAVVIAAVPGRPSKPVFEPVRRRGTIGGTCDPGIIVRVCAACFGSDFCLEC